MRFTLIFLITFYCFSSFSQTPAPTAKEVLHKMMSAIDNVKTARYSLKKQERIHKKMVQSEILVKLHTNPLKMYVYSIKPNPGAEVLYVKGENNNNAAVSANKFPFVTLNMSPQNSLIRSGQHHSMTDIGFSYLNGVLKTTLAKKGESFYSWLTYEGLADYNGKQYQKLIIENKSFGYTTYEVRKGETITSIAEKLNVNDYMILSVNPVCNDYNDVRPGQKIKVPTSYAKRIVLYIDKLTNLPFVQQIYDDKGLYEYYEFSSFILNPVISPAEFTTTYKDYHF